MISVCFHRNWLEGVNTGTAFRKQGPHGFAARNDKLSKTLITFQFSAGAKKTRTDNSS